MGLCATTWQRALRPQVFGHGSTHFLFTQALFWEHSELTMHSGRHDGGVPMKPFSQVQTLCPLTARQILFGPHGDGWHGNTGADVGGSSVNVINR